MHILLLIIQKKKSFVLLPSTTNKYLSTDHILL